MLLVFLIREAHLGIIYGLAAKSGALLTKEKIYSSWVSLN